MGANRGSGYGEEVSRLRRADQLVSQVGILWRGCLNHFSEMIVMYVFSGGGILQAINQGKSKRISLQTVTTAEAVQKTIQKALTTAEKDNSTIYHDQVPDYSTLQGVSPVSMVKATPTLPEYYTNDPHLLSGLVPKAIREMSALRQERVDTLLREVTGLASAATNEGRASLSRIGLPGSLEVYLTGGELPDTLWKKFASIQRLGGVTQLKK